MSQYSGTDGFVSSTQSSLLNHTMEATQRTSHDAHFTQDSDPFLYNTLSTKQSELSIDRRLAKLNQDILAEYEEARQAILTNQQSYRALVERFLTFASESKQIYTKTAELHEQASKQWAGQEDLFPPLHLRLVINVSILYAKADKEALTKLLLKSPYVAYQAFEDAIAEIWKGFDTKVALPSPRLGICGWLGRHHVTPRGLSSSMINTLIAVEGVVNKCSTVSPKLSQSVYVGEPLYDTMNLQEKSVYVRPHYDLTDFTKTIMDNGAPPPVDPLGQVVHRQEIGLSTYRNYQTFVIQETPEDSSIGQMPRYVSVIVQDDLCNVIKCGDRVRVWGIYRTATGKADHTNTGIGRPFLVANNIQVKDKTTSVHITSEDIRKFHLLASKDDVLACLTRSIAPSICGHEIVKRGILLQLVGGRECEGGRGDGGHRIRGDIHILLVGDPGCGKSQLLRYVMALMPNTVSTTGRGSTGVGLTAAVVQDESGERRVEGGAMVMGDRRIVCIDEFDKMPTSDRVAIHEVLEQQTVTVAKAGIHTTLNARCTVLAAANPLYGCWSDDLDLEQQLHFEKSLLSRFDLIYIIRDSSTDVQDDKISEAILRNITQKSKPVRVARTKTGNSCVIQPRDEDLNQSIHYNVLANGESRVQEEHRTPKKMRLDSNVEDVFRNRSEMTYIDALGREYDILDSEFLRKYVYYCKNVYYREMEATKGWKPYPEISETAMEAIKNLYIELRVKVRTTRCLQTVSPRTLEAIIRLSTAHAKLKLNRWVTKENVQAVKRLLLHTLFGEQSDDATLESSDSEYEETPKKRTRRKKKDELLEPAETPRGRTTVQALPNAADQREDGMGPDHNDHSIETHSGMDGQDPSSILPPIQESTQFVASAEAPEHTVTLLTCLKNLDAGDGVDLTDLYIAFKKHARISMNDFRALLQGLHNSENAPIVYSEDDNRIYSC